MPNDLREQAEKVIARCRYLAQFSEEPGQIKRTFLSPAMRDCMQAVQGWMEAAGMTGSDGCSRQSARAISWRLIPRTLA